MRLLLIFVIGGVFMSCNSADNSKQNDKPIAGNQAFMIAKADLPKFKTEALEGSPDAAFKLYQFYEFVQLDAKESLYWITISAENGHPIGQHNLAYMLMDDPDLNSRLRARYWAKQSVRNGNKDALELLKEIDNKKKP